jgi:hypothetical protein
MVPPGHGSGSIESGEFPVILHGHKSPCQTQAGLWTTSPRFARAKKIFHYAECYFTIP